MYLETSSELTAEGRFGRFSSGTLSARNYVTLKYYFASVIPSLCKHPDVAFAHFIKA